MGVVNVGIFTNIGLNKQRFRDIGDFQVMLFNTGNRTLRAVWNTELTQNLRAFHNMDAEAELTRILSEHIAEQIDNQIIQQMNQPVGNVFYVDYQFLRLSKYSPYLIIPKHDILVSKRINNN